jgi:hypothetical protein
MICILKALFALILLPIRRIVIPEVYFNNTVYESFSINKLPKDFGPYSTNLMSNFMRKSKFSNDISWSFAYQPSNSTLVNNIMKTVGKELNFNLKCD